MEEQQVRDELNKLLGTALGIAREQLEQQGAFIPVAIVISDAGELNMVAVAPTEAAGSGMDGAEPQLDADAMVNDLFEALTEQKSQLNAAAVACDIFLPEESRDAIHVMAEHSTGVGISAVQPYNHDAGHWVFDEPFLEAGEVRIWQ